jgi:hypothetical protein
MALRQKEFNLSSLIKQLSSTQKQLNDLSRNSEHVNAGVFRHTAAQSITTGTTILTWDTVIRNIGITWDATNKIFTLNSTGLYIITTTTFVSTAVNMVGILYVNGVQQQVFAKNYLSGADQAHTHTTVGYFNKDDELQIGVQASAASTITVRAHASSFLSPFLYIAQLTPRFS